MSDTNSTESLKGKVLLIDGDIIAWRAAAVSEKKHYLVTSKDTITRVEDAKSAKELVKGLGEDALIWNRVEDRGDEFAYEALKGSMDALIDKLRPTRYEIYLSGPKNFRKDISKTYKASREFLPRPKYLRHLREVLKLEYGAKEAEFGEADDELGIRASELRGEGIIASIDKDLSQIPGWHYDWTQDRVSQIGPKEAAFAFYQQLLTGDRTDDVDGIRGIGPVKARYILEGGKNTSDLFERVWSVYRDQSGKESSLEAFEYMVQQGRLLHICTKRGELWNPPYIPSEVIEYVAENQSQQSGPAIKETNGAGVALNLSHTSGF